VETSPPAGGMGGVGTRLLHGREGHAHVRGASWTALLAAHVGALHAPPKEHFEPYPNWQEETSIFRANIKAFFKEILRIWMRFFAGMLR
jgi:hypothetical protein